MRDVLLGLDDLPDSLALARSIGWSDGEAEWRILYACARVFGVRDGSDGLLAQGLVCGFGAVATVGKLIVRDSARRRGLGRRLMARALDAAAADGAQTVALVATAEGHPLYRALGFGDVGEVQVLTRIAGAGRLPPSLARPLDGGDVEALFGFDREIMGCDRAPMLRARLAAAEAAFVVDGRDGPAGFALGVAQGATRLVGPVLARDAATAEALVTAAKRS
jgi:GNAT superfamily N-acetyltransferase